MPALQHPRGWLDMQYLAHPFDVMFDVIVPPHFSVWCDCSASLFVLNSSAPDDAGAMICLVIWCCVSSVVIVFVFVFVWASCSSISSSLCSHLVRRFHVCVRLRVVISFVIFVFVYVFARSRSQVNEWVSWLPKPILVCLRAALLEGGASQGWRCLREALLLGGAAWGWRWLFTWIDNPWKIC